MKTMRAALVLAFVFVVGAVSARDAHAQKWAEGVSDAQKAEAQARLQEGNQEFLAQKYKEALDKYQLAIKAWDHPAIRFNVVRCLIQLDRPVEASDNLQAALAFGAEPLEEAVYTEALSYQKLLKDLVAEIEVVCTQEGAKLTLDGEPLMNCPGKEKRRVKPGSHSVVGTKDGFLTKEMRVVVVGGTTETADVKLVPLDKAAKVVHRWPTWIPWVVFGSSLAVVGFGTFLQVQARGDMSDYDTQVATRCAVSGCDLNDPQYKDLVDLRDGAQTKNKIAVGVISVGAVGAAIGGVMLFMNRGRTVYEEPMKPGQAKLNIVPTQAYDGGMVTLSGRF